MKCQGDKPTCQRRDKCQNACDLRVKYVEGYEAGRAATVAQWADHLKRMNAALMAGRKTPNVRGNLAETAAQEVEKCHRK